LLNDFEKTDQGFTTFFYAGLRLTILFIIRQHIKPSLPGHLLLLNYGAAYLFSELEKITILGFDWMLSIHSTQNQLIAFSTPTDLVVSEHDFICFSLLCLAIFVQFGFTSIRSKINTYNYFN